MRSATRKSLDTIATRARAFLTLAGVFAVGVLSSLGIATGGRLQTAPVVDGSHQARGLQAVESRLHVAPDRQKAAEPGSAGHSPALVAAITPSASIEFVQPVSRGQTSSALVPLWLLVTAPPRAPPGASARA